MTRVNVAFRRLAIQATTFSRPFLWGSRIECNAICFLRAASTANVENQLDTPSSPLAQQIPASPSADVIRKSASVDPREKPKRRITISPQDAAQRARHYYGTVERAGTMKQTVRVTREELHYDKFLKKHFVQPRRRLVHDPEDVLNEGDVIEFGLFDSETAAARREKGKDVRYTLKRVVTPFGLAVEDRTPRTWVVNPKRTVAQNQRLAELAKQANRQARKDKKKGITT